MTQKTRQAVTTPSREMVLAGLHELSLCCDPRASVCEVSEGILARVYNAMVGARSSQVRDGS